MGNQQVQPNYSASNFTMLALDRVNDGKTFGWGVSVEDVNGHNDIYPLPRIASREEATNKLQTMLEKAKYANWQRIDRPNGAFSYFDLNTTTFGITPESREEKGHKERGERSLLLTPTCQGYNLQVTNEEYELKHKLFKPDPVWKSRESKESKKQGPEDETFYKINEW